MAILSVEELPRQVKHLLGSSPELTRKFIVVVSDGSSTSSQYISACGCTHGSAHPEFAAAKCYNVEVEERATESRLEVGVTAQYKIPDQPDTDLLPWLRPDTWKFQTQGVAVPALYYWDGNIQRPMTNSAGDYIEGLTVDEAQQKVTITANRQAFPSALAAAVTNCVNNGAYLGFAANCVKVQGISGEIALEQVNGNEVRFWKITSELLCRQTGWNLLIPDVGFNFIEGGQKKRAYVIGPPPDLAEIPSANPVALDGAGGMVAAGNFPAILNRRVYRQITMSQFFGSPPA